MTVLKIKCVITSQWLKLRLPNFYMFYTNFLPPRPSTVLESSCQVPAILDANRRLQTAQLYDGHKFFCQNWDIYSYAHAYIYVTGSEKISLIAHVSRFDFSSWTEWYMNKLLNFMFKTSYNQVVCFCWLLSEAQWWSVLVIWCSNGGLATLGMAVSGCTALWYWIKVYAVNFPWF